MNKLTVPEEMEAALKVASHVPSRHCVVDSRIQDELTRIRQR